MKKALKAGILFVDEQVARSGTFMGSGMRIALFSKNEHPVKPYPMELEVVYEDDHLVVVNKPPGLPTSGNLYRTLEAALAHCLSLPKIAGYLSQPKPVHRLDSLTSGLVIAAKTIESRYLLGQLFEKGEVQKTYQALVMGSTPTHGIIRDAVDGKLAETRYTRLTAVRSLKNDYLTLLQLLPKTGRTHQLRVHCAHQGFPIYGDPLYAGQTIKGKGLFLTATSLLLPHPITGHMLSVGIDLPSKFYARMQNEQHRWDRHQKQID